MAQLMTGWFSSMKAGRQPDMARLRGRCQRGRRLVAAVPHGHWRNSAFVAALWMRGYDGSYDAVRRYARLWS
jgi:hypothetical protein